MKGRAIPTSQRCAAPSNNFEHRGEIGSSVCVYKDGEKVVDLWGGYVDRQKQLPWDKDTIVIMNSVSKSMSALCVHMLIDRGVIGFDEPVANYWPEFAQAGKEAVLVRHVLSHTDGVIFSDAAPAGSWFDWNAHVKALEVQEPAWQPGTGGAYNSVNIGFLLGELVRRTTGKSIGKFWREEVTRPLGVDYQIGLQPDEIARVSDMHENPKNGFFQIAGDPTTRCRARSDRGRKATFKTSASCARLKCLRSAATAMHAPSLGSMPCWPATAKSMASGCSRPRPSSARRNWSGTTIVS